MGRTDRDAGGPRPSPQGHFGAQDGPLSPFPNSRSSRPQTSVLAYNTAGLPGVERRNDPEERHDEETARVGGAKASAVGDNKQLQSVSGEETDEEQPYGPSPGEEVKASKKNSGRAEEVNMILGPVSDESEAAAAIMRKVLASAEGPTRAGGIALPPATGNAIVIDGVPDVREGLVAATIMEPQKNKEALEVSGDFPEASSSPVGAASSADVNRPDPAEGLPHFELESADRKHGDQTDADLPAFADTENVAIYDAIKEKQRILCQNEAETGHKAERVTLMRQHLEQLRAEAAQLEALSSAKARHISSDRHMQGVAIRQVSKLKGETQHQQEQQQELQNRLTGLQIDIARGQEQIDCFKLRMKWSEEELTQWRSAALQKEEDLKVVREFQRQDDARAAELIAQTQRASAEVAEARKRLREKETAARAARAELQRSIEQFSEQQKSRAVFIAQGTLTAVGRETAVQEIWRVDNRIDRLTKTYEKVQQAVREQLEKFASEQLVRPEIRSLCLVEHAQAASAQGFAKREELQNKALRGEVTFAEQQLGTSRELICDANAAVSQLAEQVAGLRGQLSAAASRGKAAKRQLAELHETLADQQQRLDGLRKKMDSAEKRLAREKKNVRSAGEAGEASEAFHAHAAARLQQLQQQVKSSRDSLFGVLQSLTEEKATLKLKRGRLSSSKNALKNLEAQLQQQEAERSRQQELLYSIDFQCQAMQRRLTLASGYKTASEAKTLQKHIKELQAESSSQLEEQSALSAQVKQLESELRKAQRGLNKVDAEESRCATSVEEIRLACISLDKELHIALQQKEELVLAESLRKLEVNKLHEELEACADASLEAENRKLQQRLRAQEVLGALDSELDAAQGQLDTDVNAQRAAEEERHKLAKEASERRAKLVGLESRYENLLQEREELQRLGAALHRRLQTASAEVEGLEATVRDVKTSNARLRSRLQRQTGALTALRGEKEEKENALFLKKHLTFTQNQQIEALKRATKLKQKSLEEAKTTHQAVLNGLEVAEGEWKRLQSQSCLLEDKLSRTLQQLEKTHANIQERRTLTSSAHLENGPASPEFCNAEMRCHAESLRVLLRSLYAAIG